MSKTVVTNIFGLGLLSLLIMQCKNDELAKGARIQKKLHQTWQTEEAHKGAVVLIDAGTGLTTTFKAKGPLPGKNLAPPLWPASEKPAEPDFAGNNDSFNRSDGFSVQASHGREASLNAWSASWGLFRKHNALTVEIDYETGIPGGRVSGVSRNSFFDFAGE